MITAQQVYNAFKAKGYAFYNSTLDNVINVNIFGIRDRKGAMNSYCDWLGVIWKTNKNEIKMKIWPASTKAGLYYFNNPMNGKDTCIIKEGQYKSAYEIGNYHNYKALRQVKPLVYYRDSNRDNKADYDEATLQTALRQTHIHKSGKDSTIVHNWSAGCQVFKRESDFNEFMNIIDKSSKYYGTTFTYTLFKLDDIK